MATAVIDASVAAKWYLPEEHQREAWALLGAFEQGKLDLAAPDLIVYEMSSILRGRVARRELSLIEATTVLKEFWEELAICLVVSPKERAFLSTDRMREAMRWRALAPRAPAHTSCTRTAQRETRDS